MNQWFWVLIFTVSAAILYFALRKPPVVVQASPALDITALLGVVASAVELI